MRGMGGPGGHMMSPAARSGPQSYGPPGGGGGYGPPMGRGGPMGPPQGYGMRGEFNNLFFNGTFDQNGIKNLCWGNISNINICINFTWTDIFL